MPSRLTRNPARVSAARMWRSLDEPSVAEPRLRVAQSISRRSLRRDICGRPDLYDMEYDMRTWSGTDDSVDVVVIACCSVSHLVTWTIAAGLTSGTGVDSLGRSAAPHSNSPVTKR